MFMPSICNFAQYISSLSGKMSLFKDDVLRGMKGSVFPFPVFKCSPYIDITMFGKVMPFGGI